jgi:hypothetical protein
MAVCRGAFAVRGEGQASAAHCCKGLSGGGRESLFVCGYRGGRGGIGGSVLEERQVVRV